MKSWINSDIKNIFQIKIENDKPIVINKRIA